MNKSATITILDQLNVKITGVSAVDLSLIISKIAIMLPNSRHTSSYKIGAWDGKESQLLVDGSTFLFMLGKILPMLEVLHYDLSLVDNRNPSDLQSTPIDKDYLVDSGIELRHYQVTGINAAIEHRIGLIDYATASGKTIICASVCKYFNDIGSITIVPSVTLLNQTFSDYKRIGLDVAKFGGKNREIKSKHIISTWQTLSRSPESFKGFTGIFILDECHIMGDSMYSLLSNQLKNSPVRIGLSGTIPTNKWKREKLNVHIGGDVLVKIMPSQLIEEKYISPLEITVVPLKHTINLPDKEWETELAYLNKNPVRISAIAEYIKSLPTSKKRLILVHPEFGEKLVKILGHDFIRNEISQNERDKFIAKFKECDQYTLCASYGTMGTGVSIDEISEIILIEAGKNRTRIIQSIGRGLRLDKNNNGKVLNVMDVYTEMYVDKGKTKSFGFSGQVHLKERLKIYKEYEYKYVFGESIII